MEANNQNLGALLPINENNGQKAVNARDLHSFLESKRQFSDWIKERINQYGFVENQDYQILASQNNEASWGGQNKIEYALSIDMAKELSMVERSEKGKQARRYFIACEGKLREVTAKGYIEPQQVQPQQANSLKEHIEAFGVWVQMTGDTLKLDDFSKFLMIKQEGERLSLPVPPAPKSDGPVDSATNLLKSNNVMNGKKAMSAVSFNKILIEKGYMRDISRINSKGKNDPYKSLTDKGLRFGINRWSENSTSPATQPYFYIDKFPELLKEVGLK